MMKKSSQLSIPFRFGMKQWFVLIALLIALLGNHSARFVWAAPEEVAISCTGKPTWNATTVYGAPPTAAGTVDVQYLGHGYHAQWWTQNETPVVGGGTSMVWQDLGACDLPATATPMPTNTPAATPTPPATPVPGLEIGVESKTVSGNTSVMVYGSGNASNAISGVTVNLTYDTAQLTIACPASPSMTGTFQGACNPNYMPAIRGTSAMKTVRAAVVTSSPQTAVMTPLLNVTVSCVSGFTGTATITVANQQVAKADGTSMSFGNKNATINCSSTVPTAIDLSSITGESGSALLIVLISVGGLSFLVWKARRYGTTLMLIGLFGAGVVMMGSTRPTLAAGNAGYQPAVISQVTNARSIDAVAAAGGDVNCDGMISVVDGLFIKKYTASQMTTSASCPPTAGTLSMDQCDISSDSTCNMTDGQHVLECVVGNMTDCAGAMTSTLYHRICHVGDVQTPAAVVPFTAGPSTGNQDVCRPDGLVKGNAGNVPYCKAYDTSGREIMTSPRRIIGYFASWRTGYNDDPAFLVSDIPWNKVTHINYAFGHVDVANGFKVSAGNENPGNSATDMTWPGIAGAEMDPALSAPHTTPAGMNPGYTGHFNLLNKFKKKHPYVKTMISIGGWAETGGHFGPDGSYVADGGFYEVATTPTGVDQPAINAFADSAVQFIRLYGFDGVDIDFEYAAGLMKAGNPTDYAISDTRRLYLMQGYSAMMKTLREKLDTASIADGKYYLLTAAVSGSGYVLRGQDTYQPVEYMDFANMMTYDLHGAWNGFVGHDAPLYDTGLDNELKAWDVYSTAEYGGMGYLNTDWSFHYYRGRLQPGRINVGLPYYTRGWKNVTGGTNGLWGIAPTSESTCPLGTNPPSPDGKGCGDGATGIDNIWHDLGTTGSELPAGANPMWHAMNLDNGKPGVYASRYTTDTTITGDYQRFYDDKAVAPWLWNSTKKVFISTEDTESVATKLQYVISKGIGGVLNWEFSGDYDNCAPDSYGGAEYGMGSTLTRLTYDTFKTASAYGVQRMGAMPSPAPTKQLDVKVEFDNFFGTIVDDFWPQTPGLKITNNSSVAISGAVLAFDLPTSAPKTIASWAGFTWTVTPGHSGPNANTGITGDFHRVSVNLGWRTIPANGVFTDYGDPIVYYYPTTGPSNVTLTFGGVTYALKSERPTLPAGP